MCLHGMEGEQGREAAGEGDHIRWAGRGHKVDEQHCVGFELVGRQALIGQ